MDINKCEITLSQLISYLILNINIKYVVNSLKKIFEEAKTNLWYNGQ